MSLDNSMISVAYSSQGLFSAHGRLDARPGHSPGQESAAQQSRDPGWVILAILCWTISNTQSLSWRARDMGHRVAHQILNASSHKIH